MPILPNLLKAEDNHIVAHTLNAYSYVTLTPDSIKLALDTHKLLPVDIVKFLDNESPTVKALAMRNIGNLLTLTPCPYLPVTHRHYLVFLIRII